MKLGTLKTGGRDGTLVVVSGDLSRQRLVPEIATTLQAVLDDWEGLAPDLAQVSAALNAREGPFERFEPAAMAAPLPRAFQWADGSAYVNFAELTRKASGAQAPQSIWADALMYQGGSDTFLGPRDPIAFESQDWGIDFEAELAVIADDVPMGCSAEAAKSHIRLMMLVNDISLRALVAAEMSKSLGYFQSKPSSAFSPVAVTPDELGAAWNGQKLELPILSHVNDKPFGKPNTGVDLSFDFPTLIAHAAKTRRLGTGTIIGSGMVSNRQGAGDGTTIADGGVGHSSIAELRALETLQHGKPKSPFLRFGDTVRIEMFSPDGRTIFGAIDQKVKRFHPEV